MWDHPQHERSTQVPTRNVSENDLSLVLCNLNRKKVNRTDNIRRPRPSVRKEKRQPKYKPWKREGYDLSRLTSPTLSQDPSSRSGAHVGPRETGVRFLCRICCKPDKRESSRAAEWSLALPFHEPGCRVGCCSPPTPRALGLVLCDRMAGPAEKGVQETTLVQDREAEVAPIKPAEKPSRAPRSHHGSPLARLPQNPQICHRKTVQDQATCHSPGLSSSCCARAPVRRISRLAASRTPCGTFLIYRSRVFQC